MHIAKDLLASQEEAAAYSLEAGAAIDAAAAADADSERIDTALCVVAEAKAARTREAELSTAWSLHRAEVYELVALAVRVLGSVPGQCTPSLHLTEETL
jgi:hypothetical protein